MNICRITNDPITPRSSIACAKSPIQAKDVSHRAHKPLPNPPSYISNPKHPPPPSFQATLTIYVATPKAPLPDRLPYTTPQQSTRFSKHPSPSGIGGSGFVLWLPDEDFPEGDISDIVVPHSKGVDTPGFEVEAGVAVAGWNGYGGRVCVNIVRAE